MIPFRILASGPNNAWAMTVRQFDLRAPCSPDSEIIGSLLHLWLCRIASTCTDVWLFSLLHLWSNFITLILWSVDLLHLLKSYYIYGHFLLHLWVIQHYFRVYSDSLCSTVRSDNKVGYIILLLYQSILCQCLEVIVNHCQKKKLQWRKNLAGNFRHALK